MIGVKPILVGVFLSTLLLVLVALPTQANEYGKLKKAVALVKSEQLAPAGVEVTSFAEYNWVAYVFHAWFFSDNTFTLNQILSTPLILPLHRWKLPSIAHDSRFFIISVAYTTSPYPTVKFLVANATHAFQLQCGSGDSCAPIANAVAIPGKPIQRIAALNAGAAIASELILASSDTLYWLYSSPLGLTVRQSYSWKNSAFAKAFPAADLISGLGTTKMNYLILISLSPHDHQGPGYIVALQWSYVAPLKLRTVTKLNRATFNLDWYTSLLHPAPIYYWLVQNPYTNDSTPDAFVPSMGGKGSRAAASGDVFTPDMHWSNSFAIDPNSHLGLIFAGNSTTRGFRAYTPSLALGGWLPEVRLRTPTVFLLNYSMPVYAAELFSQIYTQTLASAAAKNLETGVWHELIFDYSGASAALSSLPDHQDDTSTAQVLHFRDFSSEFAPNCAPSDCNLENTASCPLERCWALAGSDSFMCCRHPPI